MMRFTTITLRELNAVDQSKLATALMAVVPTLSFFYIGILRVTGRGLPFVAEALASVCTVILAVSGYRIMCKFPNNIVRIRDHIEKVTKGVLPEKFVLTQSVNSDDIAFIENNFNAMLEEMNNRLAVIRRRLEYEFRLRQEVEQKEQAVSRLKNYPQLVQQVCLAWRQTIKICASLQSKVFMLKKHANSIEEMKNIKTIMDDVEEISEALQRIKEISEIHKETDLVHDYYDEENRLAG